MALVAIGERVQVRVVEEGFGAVSPGKLLRGGNKHTLVTEGGVGR